MQKTAVAAIVVALAPQVAIAGENPPTNAQWTQEAACTAPNVFEFDDAAKRHRALFFGIGPHAAICAIGTPTSVDMSADGSKVEEISYESTGRLRFEDGRLVSILNARSGPTANVNITTVPSDSPRVAPAGECYRYEGKKVATVTFDQAITRLSKVPREKGEYETSADYTARLAKYTAAEPLVILTSRPLRSTYDADNQRLVIQRGTFNGSILDLGLPGGGSWVVSESSRVTGSYFGTNAFGVGNKVSRVVHTAQEISSFRSEFTTDRGAVGYLYVPPEEAKRLKLGLKVAYVVEPSPPFVNRVTLPVKKPTIDDPRDVTSSATTLKGTLKCGLILDAKGNVAGVYAAKQ